MLLFLLFAMWCEIELSIIMVDFSWNVGNLHGCQISSWQAFLN